MQIKPVLDTAMLESALKKATEANESTGSFADSLKASLNDVNALHKKAAQSVSDLTSGKDQEIHQTMIAAEKADISFQLMMQVRNKILSAYEEISRMQI